MKHLFPFLTRHAIPTLALLATACLTAACSSDDDRPEPVPMKPTLPADGGDNVVRIQHLGHMTSTYDWTFTYTDGRLTQADGTVRDPDPAIDQSFSYTSTLGFTATGVGITNSSGEEIEIQLNAQGYITRMTVNRNIYEFTYSDGRLASWQKTAFENSFGQVQQYRSSATITWQNGDLAQIVMTEPDNSPVTITCVPSDEINRNGLLPPTLSKELGCAGFEHLYYAGLLGRPAQHLLQSVSYTYEQSSADNYSMQFEYSNVGGNTTLCNYHTPTGGVASVSYTY